MNTKYVSGIRPTGRIHLGNYLGAIKHWVDIQNSGARCYFFVADLHGKFLQHDVTRTKESLIKCGISADNISYQSSYGISILKLAHDFSFHVTTGQLNRMTQFKEKKEGTLALYAFRY